MNYIQVSETEWVNMDLVTDFELKSDVLVVYFQFTGKALSGLDVVHHKTIEFEHKKYLEHFIRWLTNHTCKYKIID